MDTLTLTEQHILQIIQTNFPLTTKPYDAIGKSVGKTEQDVIEILRSLKERHIIRQISAIFNASLLGFTSTLISFHVQEHTIDDTAEIINTHPGVSHNYQRDHHFNLWFTLSVPKDLNIEQHIQKLAELTSCTQYLYLPSLRMFKRQVQLDMPANRQKPETILQPSETLPKMSSKITLPQEIQCGIMNELQKDLPLSSTPFKEIAERFQVEEDILFNFITFLTTSHKMTRFAGILKHRNLGFTANAMVVWNLPEHILLPFAESAGMYSAVSHCYERVTYPEWPYNMYTMIHGTSRDETQKIIDDLSAGFALTCYEILYSGKEYKKQRVNYFDNAIYAWHKRHV